jgi:hypothetical protein
MSNNCISWTLKHKDPNHKNVGKRMLFELNYFPRDNSHDQSSKLFKQNQQYKMASAEAFIAEIFS